MWEVLPQGLLGRLCGPSACGRYLLSMLASPHDLLAQYCRGAAPAQQQLGGHSRHSYTHMCFTRMPLTNLACLLLLSPAPIVCCCAHTCGR